MIEDWSRAFGGGFGAGCVGGVRERGWLDELWLELFHRLRIEDFRKWDSYPD